MTLRLALIQSFTELNCSYIGASKHKMSAIKEKRGEILMHSVLSPPNLHFMLTKLYCDQCAGRKVLDL